MKRLFLWLLSLLGLIRKQADDLYRPSERALYGYFNGEKTIWQDPLVLYKNLMTEGPELSVNIKVANSSMKGNIEASNEAAKQIRNIFGIKPFTEGGLTETELSNLLVHFLNYCEGVKKNSTSIVTFAPVSENTSSSLEENQPTQNTSPSSSTEDATSTDKPMPSPSESVSPLEPSNPDLIILGPTRMEKEKP